MKKSISVVIPNYNGRALLEKNIPFLYAALSAENISYEIIIADDCSKDDSVTFIQSKYPEIVLVQNKENKGFSGNINSGILVATKELVFLLNSDIELTENYFSSLFHYFDDPKTFGVMGRIIAIDSDTIQDGAKYPLYKNGNLTTTLNYLHKNITNDKEVYTLFLSGANALVDREKLLQIGAFQELFNPFYWEDVELSIKAWKLNFVCYYDHKAICRHPTSATIGKYHKKKAVSLVARKNKILIHYLHLNGFPLLQWMSSYCIKMLLRSLTFNFSYLQSFDLFMKQFQTAKEVKENFIKTQQTVGTTEIQIKDICSTIKAQIGSQQIDTF